MAGIRGRPPKPPEERRERHLRLRLTEDEWTLLAAHAASAGMTVSAWARRRLLGGPEARRRK